MSPLVLFPILGIAALLIGFAMWAEDLALFGPKHARQLKGSAQRFCLDRCRLPDGSCPEHLAPEDCPLWHYVREDIDLDYRVDTARPVEGVL